MAQTAINKNVYPQGFDPSDAAHNGDFAMACYTMYNNGNAPLKPAPMGVPAGYTIHHYIIMSDFLIWGRRIQAFYGFIATNGDGSESVVAMRGTIGDTEWVDNILYFEKMPFIVNGKTLGMVHSGFGKIYQTIDVRPAGSDTQALSARDSRSFADKVADAIGSHRATLAAAPAAPRIVVNAHSLGGALLTQYVLENETKRPGDNILAYTFASPRVGDQQFVNSYNALPTVKTWRIHVKEDVVPNLPPDTWGFAHVDTSIEIVATGNGVQDSVSCHHSLQTYQYLLDPVNYHAGDCKA